MEKPYGAIKILSLINNQYGFFIASIGFDQKNINEVYISFYAVIALRIFNFEFVTDRFQQLDCGDFRVEYQRNIGLIGYLLKQAAADSCFACTDFAGEQDTAAFAIKAIGKVGERLPVLTRHIEISWVRRDGKGGLP